MQEDNNQNTGTPVQHKAPLSGMHPALFVLFVLFTIFVTYQILGGILAIVVLGKDVKSLSGDVVITRLLVSFSQFMFILIPVLILSLLQGNVSGKVFRLKVPRAKPFWLGLLGIIVIQPVIQSYMLVQEKILFSLPFGSGVMKMVKDFMDAFETATMNLVTAHSIPEFIAVVFVIAVTPAICEEFLFRGLIFKNFERTMPAGKSIFLTGFVFAIFHFHPFNIIPLILLGFYLTYIVYYSDSIVTGVFVHFVNNFLSAYFIFRYGRESFDKPDAPLSDNLPLLISGAVSAVVLAVILYFIKKTSSEKKDKIVVNV